MNDILRTEDLGHRYGRKWALRGCSLDLPGEQVIGLVGPNGAGKTTLLHLAVGLLRPSEGRIEVLGRDPAGPHALDDVGFVAQNKPLYHHFTVAETLRMGGWLNPRWDQDLAERRMRRANVPTDQKVGTLSGGQRSQLALALALGKRPRLLILDEPVSDLDPLARRDFFRVLMEEVADGGMTVLLSSHLLGDLERTCEHLVLLQASHVQLAGDVDELLATHRHLVGPRAQAAETAAAYEVVQAEYTERQATLTVRLTAQDTAPPEGWMARPVSLEDLVLAHMAGPGALVPEPVGVIRMRDRAEGLVAVGAGGDRAGGAGGGRGAITADASPNTAGTGPIPGPAADSLSGPAADAAAGSATTPYAAGSAPTPDQEGAPS